jgi:hypothetical protein
MKRLARCAALAPDYRSRPAASGTSLVMVYALTRLMPNEIDRNEVE